MKKRLYLRTIKFSFLPGACCLLMRHAPGKNWKILTVSIAFLFLFILPAFITACGMDRQQESEPPVQESKEDLSLSEMESRQETEMPSEGGKDMSEYDFSVFKNVELIKANLSDMGEEELAVLYQQARYCQAMTDADTDTLREIVSEDAVFTHMSGKQQTREEYFKDIEKGRLRYFTIGIDSPVVEVDGKIAQVTFTSVLNANAYGARGTYRMGGTHWFEKRDGNWISINDPNH